MSYLALNPGFGPGKICFILVFVFLQQVELRILYLASSLTEIAFVIFHPRNSSFSPMKKFAQLLPTTAFASDNQFINISNPDPFTLLKLISTKYVFPKSCSQIPIPIQFFCQPNLIKSHKFNRSFQIEKRPKNPLNYSKLRTDDETSFLHLKYRFSVSLVALSHICIGKFKTRPRGVKLSFWLTAVSIFNSIWEPMNI